MKKPRDLAIALAITTLITALTAIAQVELRFSPPDQNIAVGEVANLSVILDATLEVRTIELWVSYDKSMVTSLGGQPGQLFAESGCSLFPFFDEDDPGSWYAGCVTMGPTCFVTGPGELYRWNFEGLADGTCQVKVDSVVLYDPLAEVIANVSLAGTAILVGDLSSANMLPASQLSLTLAPNPFNPSTTIRFGGRPNELVAIEVFDLNGRRVKTLWSGQLGSEPGVVQWNGTDRRGRTAPGGTYLFRIKGAGNQKITRKGILLN